MLNKYTEGIVKKESKVNSLVKEVNQILKRTSHITIVVSDKEEK